MAYGNTLSIIEELEIEIETLRQRVELLESVIQGDSWNVSVPPLTITQTRIMRLIARRPISRPAIHEMICPDTVLNNVSVQVARIRAVLPEHLAPIRCNKGGDMRPYDVPDREALKAFLAHWDCAEEAA